MGKGHVSDEKKWLLLTFLILEGCPSSLSPAVFRNERLDDHADEMKTNESEIRITTANFMLQKNAKPFQVRPWLTGRRKLFFLVALRAPHCVDRYVR